MENEKIILEKKMLEKKMIEKNRMIIEDSIGKVSNGFIDYITLCKKYRKRIGDLIMELQYQIRKNGDLLNGLTEYSLLDQLYEQKRRYMRLEDMVYQMELRYKRIIEEVKIDPITILPIELEPIIIDLRPKPIPIIIDDHMYDLRPGFKPEIIDGIIEEHIDSTLKPGINPNLNEEIIEKHIDFDINKKL